jgi:hypothetical protein
VTEVIFSTEELGARDDTMVAFDPRVARPGKEVDDGTTVQHELPASDHDTARTRGDTTVVEPPSASPPVSSWEPPRREAAPRVITGNAQTPLPPRQAEAAVAADKARESRARPSTGAPARERSSLPMAARPTARAGAARARANVTGSPAGVGAVLTAFERKLLVICAILAVLVMGASYWIGFAQSAGP